MMKKSLLMGCVVFAMFQSLVGADLTANWLGNGFYPRIEGAIVAWQTNIPSGVIQWCDLSETSINVRSFDQQGSYPAVSGNLIVWQADFWGYDDIYGYDINNPSGGEFVVCGAANMQMMPAISGNRVVWEDKRNTTYPLIYTTVLPQTGGQLIASSTASQSTPAVSGHLVVWRDNRNNNRQIYYCDLSNTPWSAAPVYPQAYEQWRPDISGSRVVWLAMQNNNRVGLYVYDISQGQLVWSYQKNGVDNPKIDGQVVVWQEPHPQQSSVSNIRAYHLGRQQFYDIATTTADDINPDVSGNTVVWERRGTYGADIYYAVIPTPTEVSVTAPSAGFVGIAGNSAQIQWQLTGGEAPAAVALQFSADNGATWQTIAASVPFSPSVYDWTMPPVTSQQCRVRVCNPSNLEPYGISGQFTVYICDARLTADIDRDCVVNLSDLAEMANQWLRCGNPLNAQCVW